MRTKYVNPPVVEAVCEFRLSPQTKWDLTVPGLLYERIRSDFPEKEQRVAQEVVVSHTPEGIRPQLSITERVLFLTENKKMFVQVGPNLLAVTCLSPYPTWHGFKPRIEKAFQALINTVEVKVLERIGLRYVNRIQIPGESIKTGNYSGPAIEPAIRMEDYFEFFPFLGSKLPQVVDNLIVGCLFYFFDRRDSCKVQLSSAIPDKPDNVAYILDLDYFLAQPQTVPVNQAMDWVEGAHQEVERIFEGCITERLRQFFRR